MHRESLGRHRPLRVDVTVEDLPCDEAIDDFHAADFNQPIPAQGVEAGRFGIENNLAHGSARISEQTRRQGPQQGLKIAPRGRKSPARFQYGMGAPAFLAIRHLALQKSVEKFLRHAWAGHDTLFLNRRRNGGHQHGITAVFALGFIEKRHIQHDELVARAFASAMAFSSSSRTRGWTIASRRLNRSALPSSAAASFFPVHNTCGDRTGERILDQRSRTAAIERMDRRIGIMNRHAKFAQDRRGRGFSSADRTGEPQPEHCRPTSGDARRYAREELR